MANGRLVALYFENYRFGRLTGFEKAVWPQWVATSRPPAPQTYPNAPLCLPDLRALRRLHSGDPDRATILPSTMGGMPLSRGSDWSSSAGEGA